MKAMPHIGGHGRQPRKQPQRIYPKHSRRVVRCGSGSGWKTSYLAAGGFEGGASPLLSLPGRDATGGVNRRVYDLRHYASLAKLGIGRLETRFRVAQSTACLTRGLRVSPEIFLFGFFGPLWRARLGRCFCALRFWIPCLESQA